MTDWKYAKRGLIKAGYEIKKSSGDGKLWLTNGTNDVLMWITDKDGTYKYLCFIDGKNTSFHIKGCRMWIEDNGNIDTEQTYHDRSENVLRYGQHFGHHYTLEEAVNIVF